MANRSFQLKRSRLAMVFQLSILGLLGLVLQQTLPMGFGLLAWLLGFIIYGIALKAPQALYFEHLEAQQWSLLYTGTDRLQRVSIDHMVDHQLYIVVHFQNTEVKSLLIWNDQLSRTQWKALKKLAHLH